MSAALAGLGQRLHFSWQRIKYLATITWHSTEGTILSTIEIVSERENRLLSRREYVFNFKGGSGLITRQAAAEAIATKIGADRTLVKIFSLEGDFGNRDLKATAFAYNKMMDVSRQLPKYMSIRELPKEERKKARESAKTKATTVSTDAQK